MDCGCGTGGYGLFRRKGRADGEQAINGFHAQLDAGKFAEIYRNASSDMHAAASEKDLVQLLDAVHRKLGKFRSASTTGWNDNYNTSGHFMTLVQTAKYERGEAEEQFVIRIAGAETSLAGYHVNSNALIVN